MTSHDNPRVARFTQYVSETTHTLTLIGSDDGEAWFSVNGFCDGPGMTRIHFDFSDKGGPSDAAATWTKEDGVVRLVWDDGNTWVLQAATFDSKLVPGTDATAPTPFEVAAGFWFPLAGVFTSNALFMSPLTAVLARVRAQSLGPLNPLPVAVTVLSSWAWLQYGLSVPNPYIVAGNLPALTAAVYGLLQMLPLMHEAEHAPALRVVVGVFVLGCFTTFCLWTSLVFWAVESSERSAVLGVYATCIFIVLAASPLSSMGTVLATRDASSIYAPMTAAQCVNCMLWTVYGLAAAHDVFVWGPNLVGLTLGGMQLVLKLCFPSKRTELADSDGVACMTSTDIEMDDPVL